MKSIDVIGEAFVKEQGSFNMPQKSNESKELYFLSNGYKRYYFLGKNIEISNEVIEECGKDNFLQEGCHLCE